MVSEQFGGFKQRIASAVEQAVPPAEQLSDYGQELWGRAKTVLDKLGIAGIEQQAAEKINEINAEDENDRFLDLVVPRGGENLSLRTVAPIDETYDPNRSKDYINWDLTNQEEAERWLNREIIINLKLDKFTDGETISADTLVEGNRDQGAGEMFILKKTQKQAKSFANYGEAEGSALAATLLKLQTKVRATEMIQEIMAEEKIADKTELEQLVFEDYFDNFDGYLENSSYILEDAGDERLKAVVSAKMQIFRPAIEAGQLADDDYAFVHGNANLDNIKYAEDGQAYLGDWQRPGETNNHELALVYDLGDALKDAVLRLDLEKAKDFIGGAEAEIMEHYQDNPAAGEAVIKLTKLRAFSMIINDVTGEKEEYLRKELLG